MGKMQRSITRAIDRETDRQEQKKLFGCRRYHYKHEKKNKREMQLRDDNKKMQQRITRRMKQRAAYDRRIARAKSVISWIRKALNGGQK